MNKQQLIKFEEEIASLFNRGRILLSSLYQGTKIR